MSSHVEFSNFDVTEQSDSEQKLDIIQTCVKIRISKTTVMRTKEENKAKFKLR